MRVKAVNGGRTPTRVMLARPIQNPFETSEDTPPNYNPNYLEAIVEWKYKVGDLVELSVSGLHLREDYGSYNPFQPPPIALIMECFWELPSDKYAGLTQEMKYTIPEETTQEQFQRMASCDRCIKYKAQIVGEDNLTVVRESDILGLRRRNENWQPNQHL